MQTLLSKSALPILLAVGLCLSGCTEEKAKALQVAAESFKNEADTACSMGADSLMASVAMPPRTRDEISRQIAEAKVFKASTLDLIYADASIGKDGIAKTLDALSKACEAHKQLAAMYADLPRGYLFATEDVKRAQKHVVNVTMRFARLGQAFGSLPSIGKDNIARIKIIEARKRAMDVADEKTRAPLLDSVAQQILENQASEEADRAKVLTQFEKAATLGEKLAHMSMSYDQLSVADMLESLQEFSSLYGSISSRTMVAQNAVERVKAVEVRIKNDPLLNPLLDAEAIR